MSAAPIAESRSLFMASPPVGPRRVPLHHPPCYACCGNEDPMTRTATAAFDRSFALSSSSALALGFSSIVRAWKGDDATAVEQAEHAIRLSPFDPLLYIPYIGLAYAHFGAGRFGDAAIAAGRASQSNPKFTM